MTHGAIQYEIKLTLPVSAGRTYHFRFESAELCYTWHQNSGRMREAQKSARIRNLDSRRIKSVPVQITHRLLCSVRWFF